MWFEGEATEQLPLLQVNHIVALDQGGLDVDDNTEVVCKPCHLGITAEQFGHQARAGKRGVDREGRPTGEGHPWAAGGPPTPRGVQTRRPTRPDTAQCRRTQ